MTTTLLYSDTFSGSSLGAGWNRRGVASETVSGGQLVSGVAAGQGYWRSVESAVGLLADFTVELGVQTLVQNTGTTMTGIVLTDSTGTGITLAWYTGSPTGLLYLNTSSYTYPGGFATAFSGTAVYPNRIRLRKSGSNWYASYSSDDGATWSSEGTAYSRAFTVSQIGFGNVLSTLATITVNDFDVYADISAISGVPAITQSRALNGGIYLAWTMSDPNLQNYEYRINGGSWTSTVSTSAFITGLTNGTSYTIDIRGSNALGGGTASSVVLTPSASTALWLADDFNRSDSTSSLGSPNLGGPYTVRTGTWGVNVNRAYTSASTAEGLVTFPAAINVDMQATFTTIGNSMSLVARWVDSSNFWIFTTSGGTNNYGIFRRTAGTYQTIVLTSYTANAGDVVRAIAKGRYLYMFVNNVLIATGEDYFFSAATATCGMRINSNTTARFDDLLVTDAPTLIPGTPDGSSNAAVKTMEFGIDTTSPHEAFVYRGRDAKTADDGNP